MAENSKREQIILASKAILDGLSEVKTVKRTLQAYSDLQNFAVTQLPISAIVGRLPVPVEKKTTRTGEVDQIISRLNIDIVTYFQSYDETNDQEDSELSDLSDTIFAALYEDQSRGGLVLSTTVKPRENTNIWRPFVAFQLTVEHTYLHTIGGL